MVGVFQGYVNQPLQDPLEMMDVIQVADFDIFRQISRNYFRFFFSERISAY